MNLRGLRVVVVEDEALTLLLITRALKRAGLIVAGQAANGREGEALVLREKPDIVLMDLNMPVMGGLEATRLILQQFSTRILILTAYNDQQMLDEAREAGAVGCLLKPVTSSELINLIEQALLSPANPIPEGI